MQLTHKEIYQKVAQEKGIPEERVKFVGDAIFKAWQLSLKKPETIIIKIKKLGSMYIRRNKLLAEIKIKTNEKERRELGKQLSQDTDEEIDEFINHFSKRAEEYEKYVDKRNYIKSIRFQHQKEILPENDNEDN